MELRVTVMTMHATLSVPVEGETVSAEENEFLHVCSRADTRRTLRSPGKYQIVPN